MLEVIRRTAMRKRKLNTAPVTTSKNVWAKMKTLAQQPSLDKEKALLMDDLTHQQMIMEDS